MKVEEAINYRVKANIIAKLGLGKKMTLDWINSKLEEDLKSYQPIIFFARRVSSSSPSCCCRMLC
jgi:hypothetical protein